MKNTITSIAVTALLLLSFMAIADDYGIFNWKKLSFEEIAEVAAKNKVEILYMSKRKTPPKDKYFVGVDTKTLNEVTVEVSDGIWIPAVMARLTLTPFGIDEMEEYIVVDCHSGIQWQTTNQYEILWSTRQITNSATYLIMCMDFADEETLEKVFARLPSPAR